MDVSPAKRSYFTRANIWWKLLFHSTRICDHRKFLNDFLKEWVVRMDELKSDVITKDEYFEWKITQPQTCDGCEKYESKKKWRSVKTELSET